ncbi:MAG: hypothetical protein ACXABY_11185 [Candidatus Thorarchaeota archaeon]|jgi:hypothetical protein
MNDNNGGIMMKIEYKIWEPDQGLEDIQAKIFSEASGIPERAEVIRRRNLQRAPEMTRYALTKDGEPLAYVTARDASTREGRTYIGYPWSMPGCPEEVPMKIFDELLSYVENREGIKEIGTTIITRSDLREVQEKFFTERGFVEEERIFTYILPLDVVETSKLEVSEKGSKLKSKTATEDDLDHLVEIFMAEEGLRNQVSDEDAARSYFTDMVLQTGHAVLLYDGEKVVAGTAPLRLQPNGSRVRGDEERIIMRFTAIRPGYEFAWSRLLVEMAKECVNAGWTDISIQGESFFTSEGPAMAGLAELRPELTDFEAVLLKKE